MKYCYILEHNLFSQNISPKKRKKAKKRIQKYLNICEKEIQRLNRGVNNDSTTFSTIQIRM